MSEFQAALSHALNVFRQLTAQESALHECAAWCVESLRAQGKLLICGNGGSASEAQHLASELMGRFKDHRPALPALALTADAAVLTCIGNDYQFEELFSRQVRALAQPQDLLIVFTTSGRSPNIIAALRAARDLGLRSVAFLGSDGGEAKTLAGLSLLVPDHDTARVQEAHQFLMHCLMDLIERQLAMNTQQHPVASLKA